MLPRDKEMSDMLDELNLRYYVSQREGDYLYHMTRFPVIKKILKDGRLRSDLSTSPIQAKHITVSFTSAPERHLSKLPTYEPFLGASNNCYLQFPFDQLDVKPVLYPMGKGSYLGKWGRGWNTSNPMHPAYYIHTVKPEIIYEKFTEEELEVLEYNPMWMSENEWRHIGDVILENYDYKIFVISRYQIKSLAKIGFKAEIDKNLAKLFKILNQRR